MSTRIATLARMDSRVQQLIETFSSCADSFDRTGLFTGPSLFFHTRTLSLLRKYPSAAVAVLGDDFVISLYATLTAWGMHRMGPGNTKLVEFSAFADSLAGVSNEVKDLENLSLCDLAAGQLQDVSDRLWTLISQLRIGVGETRIVAGSKAMHHVLPDLVPPIDRQYTLRFFYHHTTLNQGDAVAFKEMYPQFHRIATSCRGPIQARLGHGMNTSPTKVIDNAIVGYCLMNLKRSPT